MLQADSVLSSEPKVNELIKTIQHVYLSDNRPWIIGYSGGKDSTVVLQLVWSALSGLSPDKRTKKVYCISSDTYVEMPLIEEYLHDKIKQLNHAAAIEQIPLSATTVEPEIDETFWVNLIGRGYPAPYRSFRWCTDRMKIKPTSRYIKDKIADHGEVVVVLGVRKAESASRAGSMQDMKTTESGKKVGRHIIGQYLSQHKDLPSALVFSPIEDWSTEDVWAFLRSTPPPWGGSHEKIEDLYRSAQKPNDDGEDELAEQTFGNSRFGCWTCTVVDKDKSMEAFVESGETWLSPLLKFRDDLARTTDRAFKLKHREHRRRSGRVQTSKDKEGNTRLIWGPFTLAYRKTLLEKLLATQCEVQELKNDPTLQLIKKDELLRIRQLWRTEEADWEDSVPKIYEDVTGRPLRVPKDDWAGMGPDEFEILQSVCAEHNLPTGLLTDLFDLEKSLHGMSRRSKIFDKIHSIFLKDWRTREEVFKEIGLEQTTDDFEAGLHFE